MISTCTCQLQQCVLTLQSCAGCVCLQPEVFKPTAKQASTKTAPKEVNNFKLGTTHLACACRSMQHATHVTHFAPAYMARHASSPFLCLAVVLVCPTAKDTLQQWHCFFIGKLRLLSTLTCRVLWCVLQGAGEKLGDIPNVSSC